MDSEGKHSLHDALICPIISLHPIDGPNFVIRVDPAPGSALLVDDPLLQQHRISIEVGHQKNANKNPVAEQTGQELEDEILHQDPSGSIITTLSLATATARLNKWIHYSGLSAQELWTQRNQFTNEQIPVSDRDVILQQYQKHLANHPASEIQKSFR